MAGTGDVKRVLSNTRDWPSDMQPKVDAIASGDGNKDTITEGDIALAQGKCRANHKGKKEIGAVFEAICGLETKAPVNAWTVMQRLNELRSKLSPGNPINELFEIETELVGKEKAEQARKILQNIVLKVKDRLQTEKDLTPKIKIGIVYEVARETGLKIFDQENSLFVENLIKGEIDCDSSLLLVAAVAFEFGWPVWLVTVSKHAFGRYDDGNIRFNIDRGYSPTDEYYTNIFGVVDFNSREGDIQRMRALFFNNRGYAKNKLGKSEEALKDYDKAIRLNPKFTEAYYNRGGVKYKLVRYEDAKKDYEEVVRLNPKDAEAFNVLGSIENKLGNYEKAIKIFEKAIKLNPKYASPYHNRGLAKYSLGRYEEAIKDCEEAIRLNPNLIEAQIIQALAKEELKLLEK